jgi:hypothetical protein
VNCRRSDRQSRNYIVDINDCWREDFRAQPIAVRPCGTECRDRLFKYGRYWGPCNASCGLSGVKTLYFPCYSKKNGSVVSAEACGDLPPPPKGIHQPCNRVSCSQNALEGSCQLKYAWKVISVGGCLSTSPLLVPECQGTCSAKSRSCVSTGDKSKLGLFHCPRGKHHRKSKEKRYYRHPMAVIPIFYRHPDACGCSRR